jgi:hypothetical protein
VSLTVKYPLSNGPLPHWGHLRFHPFSTAGIVGRSALLLLGLDMVGPFGFISNKVGAIRPNVIAAGCRK